MSNPSSSALNLINLIKNKAPEYLNLLTAESDEDFDEALDSIVEQAVMKLEQNGKNLKSLDEVGLTAFLASGVSIPGLTVTQETNSNGHVDLMIVADHCYPARTKLAEAKIYDGPQNHIDGLEQLLDRYTTGRERRGFLIEYVRKKNIAQLVEGLRAAMDAKLPCQQTGETVEHKIKWSFLSNHVHSCGETLGVCHVSCNLYVE